MTTRVVVLGVMALSMIVSGCQPRSPEDVATETVVPVTVAPVRTGPIVGVIHAAAVVQPAPGADFTVVAPEAARIAEIRKAEGDRVRKGELLVRFDVPSLRADETSKVAEVARAEVRVKTATTNLTRAKDLVDRGVAARREVEQAEQDLADAQAALSQAQAARQAAGALGTRADVRAPFDGIVARRLHNAGDFVEPTATDVILRVIDPVRLEVVAAVPIADVARVRLGAGAQIASGAGLDPVRLSVVSRPAAIDPATASAPVRLAFKSPPNLAAGTPVQVEIEAERRDRALLVPADAIVREAAETAVFVAGADGKAHRRVVQLGIASDADVEIVSGLQASDRVIVHGQAALPDGAAVSIAS